jgi:TonB family protein
MNYRGAALVLLIAAPALAADVPVLVPRIIDTDSNRVPSHTVVPEYPRKARRDRVEGEVQVCFNVDREGRTRRVSVRTSSNRVFEKPSKKAVRASRFRPLGDDELLPQIKSCRTFVYSLEPAESDAD